MPQSLRQVQEERRGAIARSCTQREQSGAAIAFAARTRSGKVGRLRLRRPIMRGYKIARALARHCTRELLALCSGDSVANWSLEGLRRAG